MVKSALELIAKPPFGLSWSRTWPRATSGSLSRPLSLPLRRTAAPAVLEIGAFRQRFQPYLDEFIAAKTRDYAAYSDVALLQMLWEYPRRLAACGGKRVRPYVAYLAYGALGGRDEEKALRLLVSLELFHLFCLIHDDIIDNGTERHGLPTVHRAVAARLREEGRGAEAERGSQAQALLLGDALFAWAHEAFNGDFDATRLKEARRYFSRMIDEAVIGEMLDVDMMGGAPTSIAAIQQKMLLKTASYTFIRPLQIGAALAGQGARTEKFFYDFGLALGLAFQIQDDLLDLTGTPETTRKTLFADLREGQPTYFTQYIFENGTAAQCDELKTMMGADLTHDDRPRVLRLFEESGALAQGRADIQKHLQSAHELLAHSPLPTAHRAAFAALLAQMEKRPA